MCAAISQCTPLPMELQHCPDIFIDNGCSADLFRSPCIAAAALRLLLNMTFNSDIVKYLRISPGLVVEAVILLVELEHLGLHTHHPGPAGCQGMVPDIATQATAIRSAIHLSRWAGFGNGMVPRVLDTSPPKKRMRYHAVFVGVCRNCMHCRHCSYRHLVIMQI